MNDLFIKNGNCYINNKWTKANILVSDGKIAYVGNEIKDAKEVLDAEGKNIIPGIIDPHVHLALTCNGETTADDFDTGTIAAAYGGVTTIIDFLDPTHNAKDAEASFYDRLKLAKESHIDYHLHGCIAEPNGDLEEYVKTVLKLGMKTIKLFTTYADTHRRTYEKDIRKLLELSAKYKFLVCCHIEDDNEVIFKDSFICTDIADSRPKECEFDETLLLAKMVRETGGYLYMVHCSCGETINKLKEQYGDILGKHMFIESCPQYFYLDKSNLKGENGYLYTFAPPVRDLEQQSLLKGNIDSINTIGTDHCPFKKEVKAKYPKLSGHPFGIGGIETSFVLMHKLFGDKIIDKMTKNVADLEGFSQKGAIFEGKDADFAIYEKVEPYKIGKPHGNGDYSVYEGIEVDEKIVHTISKGKFVIKNGEFVGGKGELINCD